MASTRKLPLGDVREAVAARLQGLVSADARIVVGFSGGLDSTVLLDILARLASHDRAWRVSALHVHHGLSPNADRWAAHCEAFATSRRMSCLVERVEVIPSGDGLEAAAREARYAAYRRARAEVVALAHHDDDQAETLLLNLARGAGVDGLAAMPLWRAATARDPAIVRPLLGFRRAQLMEYARAHGLVWIEDESNADHRHRRNFVRHRLLPLLRELHPGVDGNLARAAFRMGQAAEVLRTVAREDLAAAVGPGGWSLERLASRGEARALGALRVILADAGAGRVSAARLASAWHQLYAARPDADPCVDLGGVQLRRYRGRLRVVSHGRPGWPSQATWDGSHEWVVPPFAGALRFAPVVGAGLDEKMLRNGPAVLRSRSGGERFRPAGSAHTRTLKNLFQERGVPPWERVALPLLFVGNVLVWVPGVGVAAEFATAPGQAGLVPEWVPFPVVRDTRA